MTTDAISAPVNASDTGLSAYKSSVTGALKVTVTFVPCVLAAATNVSAKAPLLEASFNLEVRES